MGEAIGKYWSGVIVIVGVGCWLMMVFCLVMCVFQVYNCEGGEMLGEVFWVCLFCLQLFVWFCVMVGELLFSDVCFFLTVPCVW